MKVLVVEDEQALAKSICQYLGSENFNCEHAADFRTAQSRIDGYDYDCIILDIGLPGGSGLQLLTQLKKEHKAEGVLIISAKNSLDDRLQGLRMGADDYLTKPFHLSELSARVGAIIRRKLFQGSTEVQFDALRLDLSAKTVCVNDAPVELTRKEYELLLYFISNKGKVISKAALADHLWGEVADTAGSPDFIYTHIKNLRRKLMAAGSPDYIQSVYGMGYKLRIP